MSKFAFRWLCVCLASLAGLASPVRAAGEADGWIPLFDGQTLEGWQASENQGGFKVVNGAIAFDGTPRALAGFVCVMGVLTFLAHRFIVRRIPADERRRVAA